MIEKTGERDKIPMTSDFFIILHFFDIIFLTPSFFVRIIIPKNTMIVNMLTSIFSFL